MLSTKGIDRRIKRHVYADEHEFFAIVQPGFEEVAATEITAAGVSDTELIEGGVIFRADVETVWKIHLAAGGITRVLMRLASFRVIYFEKLHEKITEMPWELHITQGTFPAVSASASHSRLYHTGRIEQECRAAIAERIDSVFGDTVDAESADTNGQTVYVRLEDDRCTVSLDCTGEPLYRRGFRTFVERAPLRETIASMMLRFADAGKYNVLCDPMCGSGVIPIEGTLMSRGILPGSRRMFAFEKWPGHSEKGFAYTKRVMTEHAKTFPLEIRASDIDGGAVETARKNFAQAGFDDIKTCERNFFDLTPGDCGAGRILFAMNPPYGERLDTNGNAARFYREIGQKIDKDFPKCGFAIIVPGEENAKHFALRYDRRILFMNGGIPVALLVRDGATE